MSEELNRNMLYSIAFSKCDKTDDFGRKLKDIFEHVKQTLLDAANKGMFSMRMYMSGTGGIIDKYKLGCDDSHHVEQQIINRFKDLNATLIVTPYTYSIREIAFDWRTCDVT